MPVYHPHPQRQHSVQSQCCRHRARFQVAIAPAGISRTGDGTVRVALDAPPQTAAGEPADSAIQQSDADLWMPALAPSGGLLQWYSGDSEKWHEFHRQYILELQEKPAECERLRALACETQLLLLYRCQDPERNAAAVMKRHLEQLECRRRWDAGLMIGGYLFPLRDEVIRCGGLWFGRHKAWMMPDRAAWHHIHSLLPGDF